jgi:hypothetical protein
MDFGDVIRGLKTRRARPGSVFKTSEGTECSTTLTST